MDTEKKLIAIVSVDGKQIKLSEGMTLFLDRRKEEAGTSLQLTDVLMVIEDGKVKLGAPFVKGASVQATIKEALVKDDKVVVFKKKRRKGYKVKKGHRQGYTKVFIDKIITK